MWIFPVREEGVNVPGGSRLTSSSGIYAVRVLANFILK